MIDVIKSVRFSLSLFPGRIITTTNDGWVGDGIWMAPITIFDPKTVDKTFAEMPDDFRHNDLRKDIRAVIGGPVLQGMDRLIKTPLMVSNPKQLIYKCTNKQSFVYVPERIVRRFDCEVLFPLLDTQMLHRDEGWQEPQSLPLILTNNTSTVIVSAIQVAGFMKAIGGNDVQKIQQKLGGNGFFELAPSIRKFSMAGV